MNNPKIIIIHGAYGYPEENWFAWMKEKLLSRALICKVPAFPSPSGQSLKNWLAVLEKERIDSNTILIGHSLGAAFILRWLEYKPVQIRAAILVGAFIGSVGKPHFDSINKDFFAAPFNWPLIRKRSQQFISYYGEGDPYVSKSHFEGLAKQLQAQKIIISQGGHFNVDSGYTQFPQLLLHLETRFYKGKNDA